MHHNQGLETDEVLFFEKPTELVEHELVTEIEDIDIGDVLGL